MEFSIANESNNNSHPNNTMVDPQFLMSFGSLQVAEKDNTFNPFGVSNSDLISSSTTFNHNANENMWDFYLYQTNRGFQDSVNYGSFSTMDTFVPSYYPMGFDRIKNHQCDKMERLLFSVQGSVSWLLENKPFMFQELLDLCEDKRHLSLLVTDLFLNSKLIIEATFTKHGSISVQKLIKKIKHTSHAFTLTEVLAKRFCDMANHHVARCVIQKCFNVFGSGPNHVLYVELIHGYRNLATQIVGCNTLNDLIDSISGDYRTVLLDYIAKFSDYLSNDLYGNFVVQHVLGLRNKEVNDVILEKLRGQFVSLAQKRRGSHVVEKCMEASENGLVAVVNEMMQSPNSLSVVAKDLSGNYVIQKALNMTRSRGHVELYESLVENLMRQTKELERTPGGRHVINFLRNAAL